MNCIRLVKSEMQPISQKRTFHRQSRIDPTLLNPVLGIEMQITIGESPLNYPFIESRVEFRFQAASASHGDLLGPRR